MPRIQKRRVRWVLFVLLLAWAGSMFALIDLFLNVEEFDHIRPDAPLYRGMREAAHDMVGERYTETIESEAVGARRVVTVKQTAANGTVTLEKQEILLPGGGRVLHGAWRLSYDDGSKAMEGRYVEGEREGEWVGYHKNGTCAERVVYEGGKPVGIAEFFHHTGGIAQRGEYRQGKRIGSWVSNREDGKPGDEAEYSNGVRHGLTTSWHKTGEVAERGHYADGEPTGAWTYWRESGLRMNEGEFVRGKKSGVWKVWNPAGKVVAEEQWEEGKRVSSTSFAKQRHPDDETPNSGRRS